MGDEGSGSEGRRPISEEEEKGCDLGMGGGEERSNCESIDNGGGVVEVTGRVMVVGGCGGVVGRWVTRPAGTSQYLIPW